MNFDWLTSSNPIAVWWSFLLLVSTANVWLLLWLCAKGRTDAPRGRGLLTLEPLLQLAAAYVLGCAFRSVLPRADVQRLCLFDTFLSSILLGRSVATVAELCFAAQWAIVLRALADAADSDIARGAARAILPLIMLAECCSWYAAITTDYIGNVFENSLWTMTFLFVGVALAQLANRFRGIVQLGIATTIIGIGGYMLFMITVDVPMYVARWHAQMASGRDRLGLLSGLHDLATHWVVTHDLKVWRHEIVWMSLYFSVAVWTSLGLASFASVKQAVLRYRARAPQPARQPVAAWMGGSAPLARLAPAARAVVPPDRAVEHARQPGDQRPGDAAAE